MSDAILTINQPHQINLSQISDLLTGALEGGSNYWIESWDYTPKYKKSVSTATLLHTVKFQDTLYTFPQYLIQHDDFGLVIRENATKHTLTLNRVKKGLKIMAMNYPRHFQDFISENSDAQTCDVFLQCSLLGKVIYG